MTVDCGYYRALLGEIVVVRRSLIWGGRASFKRIVEYKFLSGSANDGGFIFDPFQRNLMVVEP